jgi:hypothetical protein
MFNHVAHKFNMERIGKVIPILGQCNWNVSHG